MKLEPAWEVDSGWDEYDYNDVLGAFAVRYRQQSAIAAELAKHDDPRAAFQTLFTTALARWTEG